MAPLTRRTWANIRDEVITSVGGVDYTGFSGRVEQVTYATYLELALGWFHHELETVSAVTTSTNDVTINAPTDCFILEGVYRAATTSLGNQLDTKTFSALAGQFSTTAATPAYYCRWKDKILLNCPVSASAAGSWSLRYYAIPAPPDYSAGTSPTTAWLWDEYIIEGATAKMMGRVWRPDLQVMGMQTMASWVQGQVQPNLAEKSIVELPDIPTADRPIGGSQG